MVKIEIILKKAIRNGLIAWVILSLISFIYGGIYTEMISEDLGFSFSNILWALFDSIFVGSIIFVFILSL